MSHYPVPVPFYNSAQTLAKPEKKSNDNNNNNKTVAADVKPVFKGVVTKKKTTTTAAGSSATTKVVVVENDTSPDDAKHNNNKNKNKKNGKKKKKKTTTNGKKEEETLNWSRHTPTTKMPKKKDSGTKKGKSSSDDTTGGDPASKSAKDTPSTSTKEPDTNGSSEKKTKKSKRKSTTTKSAEDTVSPLPSNSSKKKKKQTTKKTKERKEETLDWSRHTSPTKTTTTKKKKTESGKNTKKETKKDSPGGGDPIPKSQKKDAADRDHSALTVVSPDDKKKTSKRKSVKTDTATPLPSKSSKSKNKKKKKKQQKEETLDWSRHTSPTVTKKKTSNIYNNNINSGSGKTKEKDKTKSVDEPSSKKERRKSTKSPLKPSNSSSSKKKQKKKKNMVKKPLPSSTTQNIFSRDETLKHLDKVKIDKSTVQAMIDSAVAMLHDKSHQSDIESYVYQTLAADGFPQQARRLSLRDNDLVQTLVKAISNDPSITEIDMDESHTTRFQQHVSKALLIEFADSLRNNLHITKLTMTGLELGNDFLSSLGNSLESNFTVKTIDLSKNNFTSDGLVEFCSCLRHNTTATTIHLKTQQSLISASEWEEVVVEMLEHNKTLTTLEVEVESKEGTKKLKDLLKRNTTKKASSKKKQSKQAEDDARLVQFFKEQADRAIEMWEHRRAEVEMQKVDNDDWAYLYELSVQFDKYKLLEQQEEKSNNTGGGRAKQDEPEMAPPKSGKKRSSPSKGNKGDNKFNSLEGSLMVPFKADGTFLTEEYISGFLKEAPGNDNDGLIFDYCNQFKLFKQFPPIDPNREKIVTKFVDALLIHPRSEELTGINMANSCCADDFFVTLADKCLSDDSYLPNLHTLNAETNHLGESGIVAIAKCISNPTTFPYLQVLKLENQRSPIPSKAETSLARSLCVSRSVVRFNLRVRNLREREQINKYIVRNIDFLRQARRHHAIDTGTLQARKRNEMEEMFDKIAADDPSITEVNLVGNQKFLSLIDSEKIKAGAAFAGNSHVTIVRMNTLQLDDKFAAALGKALETNEAIEQLLLDSNAISGEGMKALFAGVGKNSTIVEMQVRHQSKTTGSADEEKLPELVDPNMTITKLGIDIRSQLAKMKLDRKLAQNRELQRKLRVHAKNTSD